MVDRKSVSRIDESEDMPSRRRTGTRRVQSQRSGRGSRRERTSAVSPDTTPRPRNRSSRTTPRVAHGGARRTRPHQTRSRHSVPKLAIAALALVIVLGIVGYSITQLLDHQSVARAEVAPGVPVHVVIEPGSTTATIGRQLADLGVIKNALAFRFSVRDAGGDGKLRAGEYDLTTGMSDEGVIDLMLAGPAAEYVDVTIPEGFTAEQVAARLAARAGVDAEEVMRLCTTGSEEFVGEHPYLEGAHGGSLEGFLFPATYSIEASTSPREVVEMMLDHFDSQVMSLDLSYAESRGMDLRDVVVIASILEREAQIAEEFPLVSSVIYNRLARPMKLQLCATVMYTMPDGTTSLTNKDLEQETPYNTYLHDGLPVGPISNPGLRALQAAAEPADTDYLYYVLTGADGSQTFTATYDEFLAAKRRGQAALGE